MNKTLHFFALVALFKCDQSESIDQSDLTSKVFLLTLIYRNLNVSCKLQFLVDKVESASKLDLFQKFNTFATTLEFEVCA